MNDNFCRPISIDSINPDHFPEVALYIRQNGNYVLYKPHDRPFTENDRDRLQRNCVEFLHVRTGDMEVISDYLEGSLTDTLARTDMSSTAKGRVLYQTSVNYVAEVFENPEKAFNVARCRNLIRHIIHFITCDRSALASLQSVIAHNYYIFVHSIQVTALTLLMHAELFLVSRDELIDVGMGAILHDVGMIFISNDILNKPDALSEMDYYKVKQHAEKGYDFLLKSGVFNDISLAIVRHHHERYDGSGYPARLKGDTIPRSVQLVALSDMYCALTTDRIYRRAISPQDAIKAMWEESREGFKEELFKRFAEVIASQELPDMTADDAQGERATTQGG